MLDKNNDPGKKTWIIADGYLPEKSNGDFVSHEAVCVLNLSAEQARIVLTIYFEDREPLQGFQAFCPAERTHHIRLDQLKTADGKTIPRGVPYAIKVESTQSVVVQHSRLDTSQKELALMTSVAYSD